MHSCKHLTSQKSLHFHLICVYICNIYIMCVYILYMYIYVPHTQRQVAIPADSIQFFFNLLLRCFKGKYLQLYLLNGLMLNI